MNDVGLNTLKNTSKCKIKQWKSKILFYGPQTELDVPSHKETEPTIQQLKKNKARGKDGMSSKLIKQGGQILWQ